MSGLLKGKEEKRKYNLKLQVKENKTNKQAKRKKKRQKSQERDFQKLDQDCGFVTERWPFSSDTERDPGFPHVITEKSDVY
jgi:predicted RNA-binding protein with RPS1 domain